MKSYALCRIAGVGLLSVLLLFGLSFGDDLGFKRETVFEAMPWTASYYLPLKLGGYYSFSNNPIWPLPFPRDTINPSYRGLAPLVDYFWVLNSGGLVFFNRDKQIVFLLDVQRKKWKEYYPRDKMVNYVSNLWVGPNDELYLNVLLSDKKTNQGGNHSEIRKYSLVGSKYAGKLEFAPIRPPFFAPDIVISPTGNLFISEMNYLTTKKYVGSDIYSRKGIGHGHTNAQDNTIDGRYFNFQKTGPNEKDAFSILNFDKNGLLAQRIGEATYCRYHFKATLDNLIIIYGHRNKTLSPTGMPAAYINLPFLLIFDPVAEKITEIDISQDIDTLFVYFNVSDISINYKGEIYAIFVYFNTPGRITGNEKIVLYRWKRS